MESSGKTPRRCKLSFLLLLPLLFSIASPAADLGEVGFEQRIGTTLSPDLQLLDEGGKPTHLGRYLGQSPIVLSFVYFKCPNLCTMVLNGMVDVIEGAHLKAGKDLILLSVSIDPSEKSDLALAKKRSYLARLGETGDENPAWHFLTAPIGTILSLTREAGFHFKKDLVAGEYDHPSGFMILTPKGKISRYFFGFRFDPAEFKKSIREASMGRSSRSLSEIILNCFHYNPENGKYGKIIIQFLQWMSVITIASLAALFAWLGMSQKKAVL